MSYLRQRYVVRDAEWIRTRTRREEERRRLALHAIERVARDAFSPRHAAEAQAEVERGDLALLERLAERRRCRSEEHTSELQSLMRISYAVFCVKKNN